MRLRYPFIDHNVVSIVHASVYMSTTIKHIGVMESDSEQVHARCIVIPRAVEGRRRPLLQPSRHPLRYLAPPL